jgi:GTP 3',8-cyclase
VTTVPLGLPTVPASAVLTGSPDRPDERALVDRFGRVATDLRVSLTDRCNLRCDYCMPAEGLDWLPRSTVLTTEEIVRLVRLAVLELGVDEVRYTGGEPLLRRDLETIVGGTAALDPRPQQSVTTNGLQLAGRAGSLRSAGLDRVNVSLDTLRPTTFSDLTRRDRFPDVLAGLAAAREAGFAPVKVNSVLMRGRNEDEASALLRFCMDNGYQLRFIEQMPLDAQHGWDRDLMITAEEILSLLRKDFRLDPDPTERGAAPAERWLVDGGPHTVGVIASVTRPFCAACDRTRLTADGQLRTCLFATTETDLRGPLRAGASDDELADLWREAMWGKAAGHGINSADFAQPQRSMSAIGG